jgi:hypothetical protein
MNKILELYDRVNAAIDASKAARDKTLVGMSNARVDHSNKTTARQTSKPSKKKNEPRKSDTQDNDFNPNLRMEDVEAIVGSRKGADPADMDRIIEFKNPKMVNPLDKVQEGLKMEPTIFPKSGSMSDMARAPVSEMMKAPSRDFDSLFKKATGASFDAKSKADRARMAELKDLISSRADLADKSDTKVALAWYASKKK